MRRAISKRICLFVAQSAVMCKQNCTCTECCFIGCFMFGKCALLSGVEVRKWNTVYFMLWIKGERGFQCTDQRSVRFYLQHFASTVVPQCRCLFVSSQTQFISLSHCSPTQSLLFIFLVAYLEVFLRRISGDRYWPVVTYSDQGWSTVTSSDPQWPVVIYSDQ